MSPNVGNFVHDLVEMAKAMETLPQVQNDLDMAKRVIDGQAQTIQNREEAIQRYKAEIETLNAKVRATEAERDDAELRFLESDDRMLKLERSFQRALEAMDETDKLIQSFKPVPPQPEPEPVVVQNPDPQTFTGFQPKDESGAPPTSSPQSGETGAMYTTDHAPASSGTVETPQPPASQGQGEVNPTLTASGQDSIMPTASASLTQADTSDTAKTENVSDKPSGPYANKYYSDHPVYVSLFDWLAGGGTEDKYYPQAVRDEYKY